MFKIIRAQDMGPNLKQFVIDAPRIARTQRPGQFVMLRLHDLGKSVPLAIHSADPAAGTISLIVHADSSTTALLNCLDRGHMILDIEGLSNETAGIGDYAQPATLSKDAEPYKAPLAGAS